MKKYIYGIIMGFVFTSLLFVIFFNDVIKYKYAYEFITHHYDGTIDKSEMEESILSGIVDGLGDEHSMYFGSENSDKFKQALTTSYEGLGIRVSIAKKEPYVTITEVMANGAASTENIYAGDLIKAVNGEPITEKNAEKVTELIKAKKEINLELYRPSTQETIQINTLSKKYTTPSVHDSLINYNGKKQAYIKIDTFIDTTGEEFAKSLNKLEKQGFDQLTIDLRDNPGGNLSTLTSIADLIVNSDKPYLSTKRGDKVVDTYTSNLSKNKDYPIVVLQNENTASAAEILASALQEINGATLIGTTTYGKGSVQRMYTIPLTDTILKLTIEHWYTANDEQIDKVGIKPDIELEDKTYDVYQIPLEEKIKLDNQTIQAFLSKIYLSLLGYEEDLSSYTFDQESVENLKDFQKENELAITGEVDVKTAFKLYQEASKVKATPKNDNIIREAFEKENNEL